MNASFDVGPKADAALVRRAKALIIGIMAREKAQAWWRTRKTCHVCKGHKLVWKVPNGELRHKGLLLEEPMETVCICPRCMGAGHLMCESLRGECRPGEREYFTI